MVFTNKIPKVLKMQILKLLIELLTSQSKLWQRYPTELPLPFGTALHKPVDTGQLLV